jgi:hypothetical protein
MRIILTLSPTCPMPAPCVAKSQYAKVHLRGLVCAAKPQA